MADIPFALDVTWTDTHGVNRMVHVRAADAVTLAVRLAEAEALFPALCGAPTAATAPTPIKPGLLGKSVV